MITYKSFVLNFIIVFTFMVFPISGSTTTAETGLDTNLKKTELDTNLIDPDEHIYNIPIGTREEKFKELFGEPTGYFRFSSTATAMLYGQQHLFFFYKQRLSGVRIGTPVLIDIYVTNHLPTHMTFNQIHWSFENGIRTNSSLQDIIDAYGDKLQMEFGSEGYTAFFKTHSTMVKFILRRDPSAGKENEAFLINILEIQNLGLTEQPGSP